MAVFAVPRDRIVDKLDAGDLPRNGPTKMYAGYGRGYRCSACDRTITPYDVECEMDFDGGASYRMHRECGAVWRDECEQRDFRAPRADKPGADRKHEPTRW
jgi:hypothetical protein